MVNQQSAHFEVYLQADTAEGTIEALKHGMRCFDPSSSYLFGFGFGTTSQQPQDEAKSPMSLFSGRLFVLPRVSLGKSLLRYILRLQYLSIRD